MSWMAELLLWVVVVLLLSVLILKTAICLSINLRAFGLLI